MHSLLLLLPHRDHLLLLSLLQMKTATAIREFYLESSHCAACWSSNYQKCNNCSKLTCSSPVQLSAHPPRPKSTVGAGACALCSTGRRGLESFPAWFQLNPDRLCDATADTGAGVERTGQMGRGCVNKGQTLVCVIHGQSVVNFYRTAYVNLRSFTYKVNKGLGDSLCVQLYPEIQQ